MDWAANDIILSKEDPKNNPPQKDISFWKRVGHFLSHGNTLTTPLAYEEANEKNQLKTKTDIHSLARDMFVQKNPEYQWENYKAIIDTAIEKNIEPKMLILVTLRRIESFSEQKTIDQQSIEKFADEISVLALSNRPGIPYTEEMAARIFKEVTPTTWKESMQAYGFDTKTITSFDTPIEKYTQGKLSKFIPAEYSVSAMESARGTTLCSRTARMNLEKMWLENPVQGGSARESFWQYTQKASKELPPPDGVKVADLYFDATPKNKEYGHRVVAFKQGSEWYVLDPYYKMGMSDSRLPKPLDQYMSMMQTKGRQFWGGHYFS